MAAKLNPAPRARPGAAAKNLLTGLAFLFTLVLCIGGVMWVLLHTTWWPIFSILLSFPVGYGLALFLFSLFAGKKDPPATGDVVPPSADTPRWPPRLPPQPPPDQPPAAGSEAQPHQHD